MKRDIFAVENIDDTLHTVRVSCYPGSFIDFERDQPVILGWSKDSITIKIMPIKREETLAEQEIRYAMEKEAREALRGEVPDRKRLIEQVSDVTRGRRDNFGRPLLNFIRIAALWHDYLAGMGKIAANQYLSPEDVSLMMVLFKVARAEHSYQDDNLTDGMGYLDCLDDMNQHMKELGYPEGIAALRHMSGDEYAHLAGRVTQK